ncbi:MAG: DDE-type integrase/transposase/recombinase [Bacillus paranthracis]|nr:DDE-type integrase/transposase/recombinase [Bacillus paranthracis]
MFVENEIVSFTDASGKEMTERILWIDDGYIICYTIDIKSAKALPIKRRLSDLEELLNQELLHVVREEPFAFVYQKEESIPQKQKDIRDDRWKIVHEIVSLEPDIYDKQKRGKLVAETCERTKKIKSVIYSYLRQYWKRGKVKNALLPDYRNSGGRGKERILGSNKTGRPRKFSDVTGEGINVTDEIKQIFQVSIKKYYHTVKKNPLSAAYQMMLKAYFAEDYVYEDGVKKPILKENNKLPTFRQFQYWYQKTYTSEEKKRKRQGDRKYELRHRAVLGTSVGEMYGPGTKYQIDATIADVYLVSSYNREWIIGRPVLYAVIDMFSRMITGIYVGLEGPSWLGASMALANAASDKVAFCKRYDIDIKPEEWDTNYLPQTLLADRGELEGYDVERLITAFNMKVENTPPYRADWKGIVEQHFRTTNLKVKPFLPGVVDTDVHVRGDRDYRLDAQLTIQEFTQIIIKCVLYHNNHHWLKKYDANEMMITDEVELIPKELWNWGVKNRSGRLRSYPEDIVKLHLLAQGNAKITYKGIEFKGMKYSCEKAIREGWFPQAREKSWRIKVSYDPRNMSYIYLLNEDGRGYEVCTLLDHQRRYLDCSLYDIEYLRAYEKYKQQEYKHKELQEKVNLDAEIEYVVKGAKKKSKTEKIPMSNAQRTKGIRKNKAFEKEARRKEEAFLLAEYKENDHHVEVLEMHVPSEVEISPATSKIDILRRKQKELKERAKRN